MENNVQETEKEVVVVRKTYDCITTSEWMLFQFLMIVPVVNIIYAFICAFNPKTEPSKRNFCLALFIAAFIALFVGMFFIGR